MTGSESNGISQNGHLPSAPIRQIDPRYKTYYGRMVGDMKGRKRDGLCCEHEVHPLDPDQRPMKERSPFRHHLPEFEHELTNKVSDRHFGNRSGMKITRRVGTWGHLDTVPSIWASRLALWRGAIESDDSLIETAVSVCLAKSLDGRDLLHLVTHPNNLKWLSETLSAWAAASPYQKEV